MIRIIHVVLVLLIFTGCVNTKQPTIRETAISLIEKNYQIDGRRLEYSQIDSTDAELQGYSIGRIYISNNDSIKLDLFHLNYIKTQIDIIGSYTISPEQYKRSLVGDSIFTIDMLKDFRRLCAEPEDNYSNITDEIREADSIAAAEAIVDDFLKSLE